MDAIAKVWPASRIGIRIAPVSPANDISDSNPQALFGHLVEKLSERKIGYIHVVEGQTQGARDYAPFDYAALRRAFSGAYIANNGYDREMAIEAVRDGRADMVAFGRWFISNPDLVERLSAGRSSTPSIARLSTAAASTAIPTIRRSKTHKERALQVRARLGAHIPSRGVLPGALGRRDAAAPFLRCR